ncbi:MAG: indolepyruvate ferredoxin oxidoreductase subunit alpha [Marinilabiliaceae bacterium]|mgnify:FL=1|nr:indolepyruvate ferredoxin oxidoreductase subunit alpha [Marinilabiliaceae bacterium]
MSEKQLLLGDHAIALGALHAGLSGVYAYPGTPSTEITEYIQLSPLARERKVHSRWCTNEKTAMEAALGMSFAGKRALVCMKHVGMNVCADPFVNSGMTGVNGGVVVVAADDPSMHSSQDEQDSRFYGKFAMIPTFEPSTQQDAYNMVQSAFELSESLKLPVLLRVVTRMAHSRAVVTTNSSIRDCNKLNPSENWRDWVLLPVNARKKNDMLTALQPKLHELSDKSEFNIQNKKGNGKKGIIACGIAYNYVMENVADMQEYDILRISQYPLPTEKIRSMASRCDSILVVEDGQPFVEEQLLGVLPHSIEIKGRLSGALPRTGELNPDNVRVALGLKAHEHAEPSETVVARPPALCQGCGHRSVYDAINNVIRNKYPDTKVFGDIGCYTLGALPPFSALSSCVDMGASITMAKGAADAGLEHAIAIIGDSTFTHSGMTGLLDAINENAAITVIISDNLTTAMTGGQDSAGLNKYEAICLGLGLDRNHLHVVEPLPKNMDEITRVITEELEYRGLSVIIPRRECIQTLSRKMKKQNAK